MNEPQVTNSYEMQAEEIWQLYPLKVGKPYAIKCIIKQIKQVGWERLMDRTRMFAAAVGTVKRFVPHPSTWFNQQRFNDDPATWVRSSGVGELKTQLTAIETLIQSHAANPDSTNHNPRCNGIEKDELDELKRKRLATIKAIAKH